MNNKLLRFPEGVMTMTEWVKAHAVRVEAVTVSWESLIVRSKFNRMDREQQQAYEAKLRAKAAKPQYRAFSVRDTFYVITKQTFLLANDKKT